MTEQFVFDKPEEMTYASWEALVDALQLYAEEWEDEEDEEDEED